MSERVVFLDRASVRADFRRPEFDHVWVDYPQTLPQEVVGRLSGATISISNKVPIMGNTIAQLPALRMIAVCATGTNNVDLDACRARGIVVSNIRDYATHTVPEHVFMLMLALRRNLLAYRAAVQAGEWQRAGRFCLMDYPIEDLHGATLGIVGGGALGSSVHRLAEAFGMRVLLAER
ncbi:MAG: glycerate dehydrogenase, partial [Acidithiobacillales bacterium SM23_46]